MELRTLGTLELRVRNGPSLRTLLNQPKRIALLVYLTLARPRGFHRRDQLLGLFWPELDDLRAHRALRQSLYFLRQALGAEVLVTRGTADIGIAQERIWCDAVALEWALQRGEAAYAFELACGELLPGFAVAGAIAFERWLEEQRSRLRLLCAQAAWCAAEKTEQSGDAERALDCARAAVGFTPGDERALRRLLALLLRLGDRASAMAAYNEFVMRLARDYELSPSPETVRLMQQIRAVPDSATYSLDAACLDSVVAL